MGEWVGVIECERPTRLRPLEAPAVATPDVPLTDRGLVLRREPQGQKSTVRGDPIRRAHASDKLRRSLNRWGCNTNDHRQSTI